MKKHFYFLACAATLLSGCGKEKAPLLLDGTYQLGPTVFATSPILLYTKAGKVDNPALLTHFLARRSLWLNPATFASADAPTPYRAPVTLIIAGTQAKLITSSSRPTKTDTSRAEITARTDQSFVLAVFDSVSTTGGFDNRCVTLAQQLHAVPEGARCVRLPPASGYSGYCFVRPMRVVTIRDGKLFAPQLSWLVQANVGRSNACGYVASREWNTFDPAVLNQLVAGDTIVVQEREIALLKQ